MALRYPEPKNERQRKLVEQIKAERAGRPLPTVDDIIGLWDLGMTGDQYIRQMRDAGR